MTIRLQLAEINFQVLKLELEHSIFAEIHSLIIKSARQLSFNDGIRHTGLQTKSRQSPQIISALFNKAFLDFKCLDNPSSTPLPHVFCRRDVISSGPEPVCASYFVEAERGALPVVGDNPSFPGSA